MTPDARVLRFPSAASGTGARDYGRFTRALPKVALAEGIRVRRLLPSDESLESDFSYLVEA